MKLEKAKDLFMMFKKYKNNFTGDLYFDIIE